MGANWRRKLLEQLQLFQIIQIYPSYAVGSKICDRKESAIRRNFHPANAKDGQNSPKGIVIVFRIKMTDMDLPLIAGGNKDQTQAVQGKLQAAGCSISRLWLIKYAERRPLVIQHIPEQEIATFPIHH